MRITRAFFVLFYSAWALMLNRSKEGAKNVHTAPHGTLTSAVSIPVPLNQESILFSNFSGKINKFLVMNQFILLVGNQSSNES